MAKVATQILIQLLVVVVAVAVAVVVVGVVVVAVVVAGVVVVVAVVVAVAVVVVAVAVAVAAAVAAGAVAVAVAVVVAVAVAVAVAVGVVVVVVVVAVAVGRDVVRRAGLAGMSLKHLTFRELWALIVHMLHIATGSNEDLSTHHAFVVRIVHHLQSSSCSEVSRRIHQTTTKLSNSTNQGHQLAVQSTQLLVLVPKALLQVSHLRLELLDMGPYLVGWSMTLRRGNFLALLLHLIHRTSACKRSPTS